MVGTALAVLAAFILGVRLGIALGYRGERRRRVELDRAKRDALAKAG